MTEALLFRYVEALRSEKSEELDTVLAEHRSHVNDITSNIESRKVPRNLRATYKDLSRTYTTRLLELEDGLEEELDRSPRGSKRSKKIDLPEPFGLIVVSKDFDRSGVVSYSFSFGNVKNELAETRRGQCVYSTPDVFAIAGGAPRLYESAGGLARIYESAESLREIINTTQTPGD